MAHKGKWRKICRVDTKHDCYNCANKQKIVETKNKITVFCDIGNGQRTVEFSRHKSPFCGAHSENK